MKKNLRLLCLGLAAATITAGFAQENVTSKLRNADMEQGVRGWGIDGESNIFGKNTKIGRPGFHGVSNMVLENWRADGTGLDNNSISQTVRELPAGTYVFGAYVAASLQGSEESNKDVVEGVTLFANEAGVPVATDNPDRGHLMKWAHTGKFNVAATVAEGGSLEVGLKVEKTNANYVIWDNATLYYFGNMSEADALNEMAKIDMAATVAIADTCLAHKMNVDSLALLNEGIAAAKAIATADQLWQLNEDLYWAINKSTKSISDYRSFNNVIAHAEDMANTEWSAQQTPGVVDALNALIVSAKATYEAATADLDDVNMIDPFHLEAYGDIVVNYNRDIEIFPVLNALFEGIYGESPYKSPTDMGVNMIGFCMSDEDVCCDAAREEIIRRYYSALCHLAEKGDNEHEVNKISLIMKQAKLSTEYRKTTVAARERKEIEGYPLLQ